MPQRPSFFEPAVRQRTVERLRRVAPSSARRWGAMSAPQMIVHLTDQMTHTLGLVPTRARGRLLRLPGMKQLFIYWLGWPKGRAKGPPEAFVTRPGRWSEDRDRLIGLVEAFAERRRDDAWPDHALFGPMSGGDWGVFCAKHFDHHLRQFGA